MFNPDQLRLANAVPQLVDRHVVEGRQARVAYRYREQSVTFGELAELVNKAGDVLRAAGADFEQRVVCIAPDSPQLVAAILGAMRVGAVAVPVSTRLSSEDYHHIVADCRPKIIVIGPEHIGVVDEIRAACAAHGLPFAARVFVIDPTADLRDGFVSWNAAMESASTQCAVAPTSADDMALMQYTSGSTGRPKGVVHLHRGLVEVVDKLVQHLELNEHDIFFSAAKLSFGYGFGNSVLFPLGLGATTILHPGLSDPLSVYDIITRCRPTVFFGVPTLYAAMLDLPDARERYDLSSLRRCVSAGEHLSTSIFNRWLDAFGLELIDGLGSTECLHIFMSGAPGQLKPGSTGTMIPGYEAELVGDNGQPVPVGEVGELRIRSTCNAARYWNRQETTRETMLGAWTRTRDLLYQDEHGHFYYVGRSDDIIKVGGMKVAPTEIEECLLRHPAVAECAVVAVTRQDGLSQVTAYVRAADSGCELSEQAMRRQLRDHLRRELAQYKWPAAIEFVAELPKTSTGKLARYRLREAAAAEPVAIAA